jgi:AraC-like DNA-binding protein
MSEQIVQHQKFWYEEQVPFHFYEVKADSSGVESTEAIHNEQAEQGTLFNHWHEDLEICYTVFGKANHHINGELVEEKPGRVIVTNEGFIHNIVPDEDNVKKSDVCTVVVLIHPDFIRENFPEYAHMYFTNHKEQASTELKACFQKIRTFVKQTKYTPLSHLYGKSLVLELLYLLGQEGVIERSVADDINVLKNIERMKGIVSHIEQHFREPLPQKEMAERFYFSSVYFSRYFKQCTGMTYTDYLTRYRVEQARKELLSTHHHIVDVALNNGFTDERRLILAFKKYYGTTPLQYRKIRQQS